MAFDHNGGSIGGVYDSVSGRGTVRLACGDVVQHIVCDCFFFKRFVRDGIVFYSISYAGNDHIVCALGKSGNYIQGADGLEEVARKSYFGSGGVACVVLDTETDRRCTTFIRFLCVYNFCIDGDLDDIES